MRVLVVDDDGAVLRLTRRLLACEGHTADCVASASEAFRQLAAERYDVILCDLHLAGLAADDFLSRLSPLDAARVVFVTGGACNQHEAEFLARQRVVYKPYTSAQLLDVITAEGA